MTCPDIRCFIESAADVMLMHRYCMYDACVRNNIIVLYNYLTKYVTSERCQTDIPGWCSYAAISMHVYTIDVATYMSLGPFAGVDTFYIQEQNTFQLYNRACYFLHQENDKQ